MELPSLLLSSLILISILILSTLKLLLLRSESSFSNLVDFIKNSPRLLEWSTERLIESPTGTVSFAPFLIFTVNPLNIEHITKTRFENYPKGKTVTSALHDLLGHGIFNVNGDEWKQQRKITSYEFKGKWLQDSVANKVRFEIENRLLPVLEKASDGGAVIDMQEIVDRFAFNSTCSLVFGDQGVDCLCERSEESERFFRAFDEAEHLSIQRVMFAFSAIWKVKKWFNLGSERRLKKAMETVDGFIQGFIQSRRARENRSSDFLSRFMDDGSHSDEFIRNVLISFMLAGRDTMPSALTWFFWLVLSRPEVLDKVLEELKSIRSRHNNVDATFTLNQLREMNYLHATISETLRLYPPVSLLPRECKEDDVLPDGTEMKKGWTVMYNSFAMARMEKIWGEDCKEFKPERWLGEGGMVFKAKNAFENPVFHAGPRMCLGKDMAYIQMKALAAIILEGFEMEMMEERGEPQLGMTLLMRGGLPVRVKNKRKD